MRIALYRSVLPSHSCLNYTSTHEEHFNPEVELAEDSEEEVQEEEYLDSEGELGEGAGMRKLVWVKGYSGVEGNEEADKRAKDTVMKGVWNSDRSLATLAGMRQSYPLFRRKPHMKWDRDKLRGLTYLRTDRGLIRGWLFMIGKAENPRCGCGEIQKAAHLLGSGCVAGKIRKWEDIWPNRSFAGRSRVF